MHPSTVAIQNILDYSKTIDGARPDEALAACQDALGLIEEDTDPEIALALRYRVLLYLSLLGHLEEGLEASNGVIDTCYELLSFTTLSKALNVKGNILGDMGLVDRALESYMGSLRLAERHYIYQMIGVVANNIGGLYQDLGELDRAREYYQRSINSLNLTEEDDQNAQLMGTVTLNLSELSLLEGQYDMALRYANDAKVFFVKSSNLHSQAHVNAAFMEIAIGQDHHDQVEYYYEAARTYYAAIKNIKDLIFIGIRYGKYLLRKNGPTDQLLDLLKDLEVHCNTAEYPKMRIEVLELLAQCYEKLGDLAQAVAYYKAYHHANAGIESANRDQQLNVMRVRFEIEQSLEEKVLVQRKNDELREKSHELLRKKEELEQAYHRIQIISQIGQKITSTLDLSEIMMSVYDNLKHHMVIDSFYMVMLNEAKTHLVSIASVEHLNFDRVFEVPIDSPNSILAYSYRKKCTLFVQDVKDDAIVGGWDFMRTTDIDIRAVICVPLLYDEDVIGVCSVQTVIPGAYVKEHLDIMEALSTYLAIAVNNAQKSKRLEQEIQMRLRTQRELERLNAELRSISEIDGLTKVPNRRRFESVYEQMFEIAVAQEQPLHAIMMDIDYFKVYNDHYGHLKGDEVLIAVAQKLNLAFRFKSRLFARYGGEEFVAVLGDMCQEEAVILAQELRVAIANMAIDHELSPTGFLTISIGVASMVPKFQDDMRRLLHQADECLYESKDRGRNRVQSKWIE